MQIVILSRGRSEAIHKRSLPMFPASSLICIPHDERDEYTRTCGAARLLPQPPDVRGVPATKNWVLRTLTDQIIVFADDDVVELKSMLQWTPRTYRDPDVTQSVLENAAECAEGFGSRLFGFNQSGNPVAYKHVQPVFLHSWVSSVFGVIGRDIIWNERLRMCADIDANLQSLLRHRTVFMDRRFAFVVLRGSNIGGNAADRSAERHAEERKLLTTTWGRYVTVRQARPKPNAKTVTTTWETVLSVPRRQHILME